MTCFPPFSSFHPISTIPVSFFFFPSSPSGQDWNSILGPCLYFFPNFVSISLPRFDTSRIPLAGTARRTKTKSVITSLLYALPFWIRITCSTRTRRLDDFLRLSHFASLSPSRCSSILGAGHQTRKRSIPFQHY